MNGIVDRIEGNIIVVELENKIYNVSIDLAIGTILEGDVVDIEFKEDKSVSLKRNDEKTLQRKEYIKNLAKDMWQ